MKHFTTDVTESSGLTAEDIYAAIAKLRDGRPYQPHQHVVNPRPQLYVIGDVTYAICAECFAPFVWHGFG